MLTHEAVNYADLLTAGRLPDLDIAPAWTRRSACLGQYELFDAALEPISATRIAAVRALTALCAQCPVRDVCRDFGAGTRSSGVFGGVELRAGRPLRRSAAAVPAAA